MPATPTLHQQQSRQQTSEQALNRVERPSYPSPSNYAKQQPKAEVSGNVVVTETRAAHTSPAKAVSIANGASALSSDGDGYKVPGLPASANGHARKGSLSASYGAASSLAGPSSSSGNGRGPIASVASARHLPPYFLPKGSRAWEKSRKADDDLSEEEVLTREELEAQLRPEEEGLVPLNAIAGRIVHHAWQLFANQVEINPSLHPLERRKRIYDDAHEARKQLIKLLVLVQWSRSAPELLVARNLIALINDHIAQTDAVIGSLSETRNILTSARLRNFDLVTATEVLLYGRPQRVPPILKDLVQNYKPYTDRQAVAVVHELDDIVRLRLASEETLPMHMLSYTVKDGRACFVVPSLFEADLTLSGPSSEDRWWLLRIKFDFHITGAGAERFPRQLRGQQRLNLLSLADAELAPRSVASAAEAAEAEGDEIPALAESIFPGDQQVTSESYFETRKDTPLVRLYNLLQSQSLHYRLDILHWQANQLVMLTWGQRLDVFVDADRVLHLRYWRRSRTLQGSAANEWNPTHHAEIRISVLSSRTMRGSLGVIKKMFEKKDDRGQQPESMHLDVQWDVGGAALEHLESRKVAIDHHNLEVEALLHNVTQRHVRAAIKAYQTRFSESPLSRTMRMDVQTRSNGAIEEHTLLIFIHSRLTVQLSIDYLSGQIEMKDVSGGSEQRNMDALSCSSLASTTRLTYLRDAAKAINERPGSIAKVLQRLRRQISIDDLEEKCALACLPCTTRLPLRQIDYAQLQGTPGSLLFVAMQQCLGYYLVLRIGEDAIDISLIYAASFMEDMITSMRIMSAERLDWMYVLESCTRAAHLGKRKRGGLDQGIERHDALVISEDNLAILHSYSVALISYHKIEEQLRQREVSFLHVDGLTGRNVSKGERRKADEGTDARPNDSTAISAVIPSLCIDAASFLGKSTTSGLVKRNVLLRLRNWDDPMQSRVEFTLKISLRKGIVTRDRIRDGGDEVHFDAKVNELKFVITDIENCFTRFLVAWRRIEKVLDFVQALLSVQKDENRSGFVMESFDLLQVAVRYADDLIVKVGWIVDLSLDRGGYFAIAFRTVTEGTEKLNPHNLVREVLQDELNRGDSSSMGFWLDFLILLQRTLPIVNSLYPLPTRCLQDAEVPELDIRSATWFRLIFLGRFHLDIRMLANGCVLFVDVHRPSSKQPPDNVSDPFTLTMLQRMDKDVLIHSAHDWSSIPAFGAIVDKVLKDFKRQEANDHQSKQGQSILTFPNALLYRGKADGVTKLIEEFIEGVRVSLRNLNA